MNERENERPRVPFLSPGVTLEITPLRSLISVRERHEKERQEIERDRERERETETRHFDTRISL